MADLESVLADVSYLMAMERSKAPGVRTVRKFALPDKSVHNVVNKYMEKNGTTFQIIFEQRMGMYFLDRFIPESCGMYKALKAMSSYERLASSEMRWKKAREIYDKYIYVELLAMNAKTYPKEMTEEVREHLTKRDSKLKQNLFQKFRIYLMKKTEEKYWKNFILSDSYMRFCQWKYMELLVPQQITLNDFSIHRIIGRGGFGEVYGCRKDDTGKMFAMKLLDKKRIKLKKGESLALNEKNMLAKVNSPFVVNLYYAYQTHDKLCFILDLMNGGDLHYHLTQHGVFTEDEVRFYAAELILALGHIHAQKIVYRDLKPSNILLDEEGHVRLSDLGLACDFSTHQPSSSVGTHGYMAPEVVKKGVQYTYTADWFSLGCVLYKLLRGHSPFRVQNAKNKEDIDKLTLEKEVPYPSSISDDMIALLSGLLKKDPGQRLCCQGRSSEELKEMSFFKTINWDNVLDKKVRPPLIPPRGEVNAADAFDIGSFDDDDTRGIKLFEEDQKIYKKFNILVSDRWQAEIIEGIFEGVNIETDKREKEKKHSNKRISSYQPDISVSDVILQGYGYKLNTGLFSKREKKYFMLYPNRIDIGDSIQTMSKGHSIPFFDPPLLLSDKDEKEGVVIRLQQIGNKKEHFIRFDADFEHEIWKESILGNIHKCNSLLHNGPRLLRDSTSESHVAGNPKGRRNAAGHTLSSIASVPLLLGEK